MNKKKIPWSDVLAMAAITTLILLLLYSAFAIGNWNINPGKWTSLSRGMFAAFYGAIAGVMIISFVLFLNSDHSK